MRKIKALGTMCLFAVLIAQAGSSSVSGQTAPKGGAGKNFIGTWRLVSYVGSDGAAQDRGTGLIIYDAFGNMAAQIMPARPRPKYAGTQPTPDEAKAALSGYTAYFGTYTVDERAQTVTHHRKGNINPGQANDDAVRRYKFLPGDRVTLIPPTGTQLTWERVK